MIRAPGWLVRRVERATLAICRRDIPCQERWNEPQEEAEDELPTDTGER